MKAARLCWFERQLDLDPDKLVFLDETAASTTMARRSGRAPRGERCRIAVPHGHDKTITVTAALRATGLAATALLDGATNGTRFRAYVRDTLVPVLKRGDTVRRGDVIAKAGQTGSVDTPQLHFELRKGATAVDPMKYLGSAQAAN